LNAVLSLGGILLASLPGCGRDPWDLGKTVSVQGRVLVDGKPLTTGLVVFQADASKGNNSRHERRGQVDPEGNYRLTTQGRDGAAPGWYKVAVIATRRTTSHNGLHTPGQWLIARQYGSTVTSGLSVYVSENAEPGAYDLELRLKGRRK
jgi:hypothetical protein